MGTLVTPSKELLAKAKLRSINRSLPETRLQAFVTGTPVGSWEFYSQSPDSDPNKKVFCIEYTVEADQLFSKDLYIFADVVSINAAIRAPGHSVNIYARSIAFGANGSVDVSGSDGTGFAPGDHAPNGTAVQMPESEAGQDGVSGTNGLAGGQINLWFGSVTGSLKCKADGGAGGRGRDGGSGQAGAQGAGGAAGLYEDDQTINAATPGGSGGRGGRAGSGGNGGAGGAGGSIQIHAVTPPSAATLNLSVNGGRGGEPGVAGNAGAGGAGGPGGSIEHIYTQGEGGSVEYGQEPPGPAGGSGAPPSQLAVAGQRGVNGAAVVNETSFTDIGATWETAHLVMLMHRIELAFLNGDYPFCTQRADWINRITAAATPPSQAASLYTQSSAVLQQLQLGLDFYGHPQNYVSLTPISQINSYCTDVLAAATVIESSFAKYTAQASTLSDKQQALQDSLVHVRGAIASAQAAVQELVKNRADIEAQISALTEALKQLGLEIQSQHDAFVRDVETKSGCGFVDCLMGVGTVLACVGTAGADIAAVVAATKVLAPGSHNAPAGRISAVEGIAHSVTDIANNYNKLKQTFHPSQPADLDFTKIAMNQKDYDDFLSQYRDLPSAVTLRNLVDRYFDIAQEKNQRLYDYSASFSNEDKTLAQIKILSETMATIEQNLTTIGMQYSQSMEAATFSGETYEQTKQLAVKMLWEKRKIAEFAILDDVDFSVNDMDVAELTNKSLLLDSIIQDYEREAQTRYVDFPVPVRFLIVETTIPGEALPQAQQTLPQLPVGGALSRLKSDGSGTLIVSIPIDFSAFTFGWSSIRISGIDLRLPGVSFPAGYGQQRISVDAIQSGISLFKNPKREVRRYVHTPVVGQVTYDVAQDAYDPALKTNLIGAGGEYVGISPFSAWKFRINPHSIGSGSPLLPNLNLVRAIEVTMYGRFQAFVQ